MLGLSEKISSFEIAGRGVDLRVAQIRVSGGAGGEKVFSLAGEHWLAGRAGCEIALSDQKASRRQFEILRTSHGWFVRDLGSSNGTSLNGSVLPALGLKPLNSRDVLKVGSLKIRFEISAGPLTREPFTSREKVGVTSAPRWQRNLIGGILAILLLGGFATLHSGVSAPLLQELKLSTLHFQSPLSYREKFEVKLRYARARGLISKAGTMAGEKSSYALDENRAKAIAELERIHQLMPDGFKDSKEIYESLKR